MAKAILNEDNSQEPKPNLYNQNKSWHTPDVMPEDNPQNAYGLFIPPTKTEANSSEVE